MSTSAQEELDKDINLKNQFLSCLSSSSIFHKKYSIYSDIDSLIQSMTLIQKKPQNQDITICIQHISLFDSQTLEILATGALKYKDSIVVSNTYRDDTVYEISENNSIDANLLYRSGIYAYINSQSKNVRLISEAQCFLAPSSDAELINTGTIIRYHKSGDMNELKNALLCLCAMKNVYTSILIAAQDLETPAKEELSNLAKSLPLKNGGDVQIQFYDTPDKNGDLRTKMLNESLLNINTRYVHFLDYDDFLFPYAYAYMIERMKKTNKTIVFGRVYYTSFISKKSLIIKRERKFEYGYSYADFLNDNHAPIHSFMLDKENLDLEKLQHHADQLYMEDYYMTLQLFTKDNADWEGLSDNVYIGDYIHSIDRSHTLAVDCDKKRDTLEADDKYKKDWQRILDMRKTKF